MLAMVLAENMVQFILGWEIMGLCSFMLIGHWWEEQANSRAALKAFFTVRVGDMGLLVGVAILFGLTGTFSIQGISQWAMDAGGSQTVADVGRDRAVHRLHRQVRSVPAAHVAARTRWPARRRSARCSTRRRWSSPASSSSPVSIRCSSTGSTSAIPGNTNFIAVIGGITILIAAGLAFVQDDIKRVLAYSTVSQLGYMMMGLGVGAWTPAVFHIFTHAFFKCCLFLCAGSVSHSGSHHSFDMRKDMGGLRTQDADHVRRRG